MGIFDDKEARKHIKNLENENKKLWERIIKLEQQNTAIQKEITLSATAQNSKKVAEFRNKSEERLKDATLFVSQIEVKLDATKKLYETILSNNNSVIYLKTEVENLHSDYHELYKELTEKIDNLSNFMEEYPELDEKLSEIAQFISDIESNLSKSKTTLNSINNRKKEIEEFYEEIFGYTDTDENGEETFVNGKKDLLEELYADLKNDIANSQEKISKINEDYKTKYSTFENEHKTKYQKVLTEIRGLLPNALTAGLSSAFSKKKTDEETLLITLQKRFQNGIFLLIGVSLIPFIVSIMYIYQGHELDETILKMPRLVLAIIPMYIPILWLTYSSSKKINLSKRLIEEYAHKEVLSKTYEGLSKQITSIDDEKQSEELKYRLLSTFLQVASENPGKLISNYEASDHPVMEALEQSYKFQLAIDKLDAIPGMGKFAAVLERKSKKKLEEKEKMINTALESIEEE